MSNTITLSDFELKDNIMKWKVNGIEFKVKYMFDTDHKFIDAFKLIPMLQVACLASSYIKTPTIKSTMPIKPEMLTMMEQFCVFQKHFNMDHLIIDEGKYELGNIYKFPIEYTYNMKGYSSIEDKVVATWSGGKDSYLSIKLLEEIGLKVLPTTTAWNSQMFNLGQNVYLTKHPEYTKNIVAKMNISNTMRKLITSILQEQSIEVNKKEFVTQSGNDPFMLYHSWYMLTQSINNVLYALHHNIRHVFMGDELSVNYKLDCNTEIYNNVGQCYKTKKIINKYLRQIYGKEATQFHSILYPIHHQLELKMIVERYKSNAFSSCYTMIGYKGWCSGCPKCFYAYISFIALGYQPEVFGIDVPKLLKKAKSKSKLGLMTELTNQLPTNYNYWIIKRIFNNESLKTFMPYLLSEDTPTDKTYTPLKPIVEEYYTIPKFIRNDIVKIYEQYE